jgi:hypothetical protein
MFNLLLVNMSTLDNSLLFNVNLYGNTRTFLDVVVKHCSLEAKLKNENIYLLFVHP